MARVIKYKANCYKCGKLCNPEDEKKLLKEGKIKHLSFLTRVNGQWKAHCNDCYELKKELK